MEKTLDRFRAVHRESYKTALDAASSLLWQPVPLFVPLQDHITAHDIFQGGHSIEISKQDWALYRQKMPQWQEKYMERLCGEYAEILGSDEPGSDRFWKLWDRIKQDQNCTGVIAQMSRSSMVMNLVNLIAEGAITLEDLTEFSEDIQDRVRFLSERYPYC